MRKGIFDILKAQAIVVRQYTADVWLILTGGGNVADAVEQATDSDVRDHITFVGYVSEAQKIELYKSAAMLLLPSCQRGFALCHSGGHGGRIAGHLNACRWDS